MNGQQLAEKLGQQRPDMKVLFTSGCTQESLPLTGVGLGEFIQKLVSGAALCWRIREVIDGQAKSKPLVPTRPMQGDLNQTPLIR